jgi:hypothetical protein
MKAARKELPAAGETVVEPEIPFVGTRGLPPVPSDEEWRERMERLRELMDEWHAEDPAYDIETVAQLEEKE